ncbi:MAG: DeoR/GlpR family DNA-binding transcription regulator [Christensenellales bacterium]
MFGAQRLKFIKDIVYEKKHIDVASLSKMLSVSEVTIRRDLDKLEQEGYIIKSHGGAMLNETIVSPDTDEAGSRYFSYELSDRHKLIGEIAACHVKDGDAVFVGCGNECYHLAVALKEKHNLIIVTNDLNIAELFISQNDIKVIVTGGILSKEKMLFTGEIVLQVLNGIFVQKAFISVDGIHLKHGYTIGEYEQQSIYNHLLHHAGQLFVLADSDKFNKISFSKIGDIDFTEYIITDVNIPMEFKEYYFNNSIKLYTAIG